MTGFIYYLAALGAILSGSMFLPSLIAFGSSEEEIGYRLLLYSSLGGFLCISTLLAISGRPVGIERRSAAWLAVTSWILFPVLVAIPLSDIVGLSFFAALFQSISSLTTTGSLVFGNPEAVPKSILFMLAQLQWLGGLATLITFILVLSPWEIGGLPKVGSASETASIIASEYRLVNFCSRLFRTMLALTLLCFVLLLLAGIPPYEGMVLSFTALSTGGIVPAVENIDLLLGNAGMLVMAVFMLLGATSIFWQRHLYGFKREELVKHRETYFLFAIWLIISVVLAFRIVQASGLGGSLTAGALSEGLMNTASILSTSGIQSRPGIFTLLAPSFVLLVVIIGGGSFSTAGGLKLFRVGVVVKHSQNELNRLIYPNSLPSGQFSNSVLNLDFMKGVWGFFSIWVMSIGLLTIVMTISGLNFQAGFTSIAAAMSNAGPLYGSYWEPASSEFWPAYADMSSFQLSVLSIAMIIGRLEIIVFFASVAMLLRKFR
ncbi:MAG: potassium transporter TrkG [Pseudomonadota bacterium]